MKAIEQYFPIVLFMHLVFLTPSDTDKILKCEHSNERYFVKYSSLFRLNFAYLVLDYKLHRVIVIILARCYEEFKARV